MRPDFIPKEVFRKYLSAGALDKYIRIGNMLPLSYINKREREGNPVRSTIINGSRVYRLLDIVAIARANNLAIDPPLETQLKKSIEELKAEKASLERRLELLSYELDSRGHDLTLSSASIMTTERALLSEEEIIEGKFRTPDVSGVYFLIKNNKVVYVGQGVNVYARVNAHMGSKDFDSFSFTPCEPAMLDLLESLYIHYLKPKLNARIANGTAMLAPVRLDTLLNLNSQLSKLKKKYWGVG